MDLVRVIVIILFELVSIFYVFNLKCFKYIKIKFEEIIKKLYNDSDNYLLFRYVIMYVKC